MWNMGRVKILEANSQEENVEDVGAEQEQLEANSHEDEVENVGAEEENEGYMFSDSR